MNQYSPELEANFEHWAQRFHALALFAERFGTVEGVRALVDAWVSGDSGLFDALVNSIDIPNFPEPPKGIWVEGILESTLGTPSSTFQNECWLIADDQMTPTQRTAYLDTLARFGYLTGPLAKVLQNPIYLSKDILGNMGYACPPGALLDALTAAGLIESCLHTVRVLGVDSGSKPQAPEWIGFPTLGFPQPVTP